MRSRHALLRSGPLRAFAYPQYRVLWGASLIAIVSFFTVMMARGWLILEMTDSPFQVTAVNAVGMLPMMVIAPLAGGLADRLNRRMLLIAADLAGFVVLLVLAFLLLTDLIEVWHVFALALLHGFTFPLGMPSRMATVPDLISQRDLASGAALFTSIFSVSQLAGPALAGIVIENLGMTAAFFIPCVMLLPAVGVLRMLRMPGKGSQKGGPSQGSFLGSLVEGLAYVRGRPLLVGLFLMGLVAVLFGMPYQALLPVFARDILNAGPGGFGWLGAMGGAGAIVGSLAVASFSSPRQMRLLMATGGMGLGLLVLLFALSTVFQLSLLLALVLGFMMQVFLTSNFTLIQVASPNYIRGRVMGIRMIIMGTGPLGMLALGIGAERFGPAPALAVMGAMTMVLMVSVIIAIPSLRRVEPGEEGDALAAKPAEGHASVTPAGSVGD